MPDQLTREQVNRRIAEFDRYYIERTDVGWVLKNMRDPSYVIDHDACTEALWEFSAPRYYSSLDALRPVLERIAEDRGMSRAFNRMIWEDCDVMDCDIPDSAAILALPTEAIARAVCAVIEEVENEKPTNTENG